MRTYRGIVCEKYENYIIFITQDGEFHKGIPLGADPDIGEEVDFSTLPISLPARKKKVIYRLTPVVLAALFFISIVAFNLLPEKQAAAAYIQLNGAHSIEIGIDNNGNVVSIENKKEEQFNLKNIEGQPIGTALDRVMNEIYKDVEELSITTKYTNESLSELKQQVENVVIEVQENFTKTNSNPKDSAPKENSNNKSLEKEDTKLDNSKEADEQEIAPQTLPNNGVNQKSTHSSSEENSNSNSGIEHKKIQESLNPSQKHENINPPVEKSKNGNQAIPNKEKQANENQPKNGKEKENPSQTEKNSNNGNQNQNK